MKKTIIDAQELAQRYLEDEVLTFEIHLLNVKEEMSDESEVVRGITGYLESLYDNFDIYDFSEIYEDIKKYINNEDVDRKSIYFRLLEKKFAEARISSLNAMLDICHGKTFKYNINEYDLNTDIEGLKLSNIMRKLLHLSRHVKPETLYVQEAVYKMVQEIKIDFKNQNKKLYKYTLVDEILKKIGNEKYNDQAVKDAKLTEVNTKRMYLKNWKDI